MNNDRPLTLKDVAQAASDRNDGARGRKLGRAAEAAGVKISYTTVDDILEGRYKSRPGRAILDALVELSGMKREDVYAAAGVPLPLRPLADDLPPDADLLSGPQRRVVIDTVRLFAQHQRELAELRAANETEVAGDGDDLAEKRAAAQRARRDAQEVSEPDETVIPAADRVNRDGDEPPGGSDDLD
jgi:hypothetical protein